MVKNQLKKNLSVKGKIQLNIKSTFFKRFHFSFSFGTKDFDTYKVFIQVWECHQDYKKVSDLNFASVFNLWAYHNKTHFYS
jgi:hypothetical protein